ncbi:MAG: hypothetical protein AAGG44_13715 [Planctomycetota bacterium]
MDQKVEIGTISLDLRDFRAKRTLPVNVRLRLMIQAPGELAVKTLSNSTFLPKEAVRGWIMGLLQDAVDAHPTEDIALWIAQNGESLENDIANLLKEKGFEAEIKVETEDLPANTKVIATENFTVRPRGIEWALPISIGLRLDHAGDAQAKPPANDTDWRRTIKDITRDYVERNETLDEVRQTEAFAKRLSDHLGIACLRFGWRIDRMDLTSDLSEFEKSLIESFETEWKSNSGRVFRFTTKVELAIAENGATQYVKEGRPVLKSWTSENLQNCFDSILFERDTDALNPDNFVEVETKLRACLTQKAKGVGFAVGIVLVKPAIEEWDYLVERQFEVPPVTYGTTNPDHDAVFSMVVDGKFPSVGPAFEASRRNKSIPEQVKDTAIDAARLVMESTELDDYISNFEELEPDERVRQRTSRVEPVQAELYRAIVARLASHLNFLVSSVQFRRIDPDIRRKIAEILREPAHTFQVDVLPNTDGIKGLPIGSRPEKALVRFTLRAELQPPDRKDVLYLAQRELDPSRLWSHVEGWSLAALDGLSQDELSCDSVEKINFLIMRLKEKVSIKLSNHGVCVDFLSIERSNSGIENVIIDEKVTGWIDIQNHQRNKLELMRNHELEYQRILLEGERKKLRELQDARSKAIVDESLGLADAERAINAANRHQSKNGPSPLSFDNVDDLNADQDANSAKRKNQWSED